MSGTHVTLSYMAIWRPMGQAEDEAGALYEGVPTWMERPLLEWLGRRTVRSTSDGYVRDVAFVDKFERLRRATYPVTDHFKAAGVGAFRAEWRNSWGEFDDTLLQFVDYCIATENAFTRARNDELEAILSECGSAWKVGTRDGFAGLERRVPLGVQDAAENTMTTAGHAGNRLSQAWHAAFGVSPDPSKAYSLAIKAVEDAAKHAVTPNDALATLGKMNNVIRDQADWSLPLQREDSTFSTKDVLLAMSRSLWAGQVDRHGGTDTPDTPPIDVTKEAAEVAVMLAVPLVQWFTSGAADRR